MAPALALQLCWALLAAAEPHSLDILITGLNELDGTHRFFMLAKLDGLELASYSSDTREVKAKSEWAERAVGTQYVRQKTQEFRLYEAISKVVTKRWMAQQNLTDGVHTMQLHVNCALDGDTPVQGRFHFAFDGDDFLSLERNQSEWVPLVPEASSERDYWDAGHTWTQFARQFLQEECVSTLSTLAKGGMEALVQQVPPGVSVTYRDAPHDSATLFCHARGFYPHPIHISWVQDGEEILAPTDSSGILPNANGTYHIWQSLEIPPQWGHSYACRVDHSSLGESALATAPSILPEVLISRRDTSNGSATLSCLTRGFYPHPIHISWVRDGKETLALADSSGISSAVSDKFQPQRSVGILPQGGDRHSYSCRVKLCGLQEALATTAPREMGTMVSWIVATLILAVLIVAGATVAGVMVRRRKHPGEDPVYSPAGQDPDGQHQTTPV